MALAKFKSVAFATYNQLAAFVTSDSSLNSVVSIVYDAASGKYILFYLTT